MQEAQRTNMTTITAAIKTEKNKDGSTTIMNREEILKKIGQHLDTWTAKARHVNKGPARLMLQTFMQNDHVAFSIIAEHKKETITRQTPILTKREDAARGRDART